MSRERCVKSIVAEPMREKTIKALFGYWNEVRGERLAPRRFEIEPSRISEMLPDTFILERLDNGELRYRLAGTRMCDHFCTEFRGGSFFEGWTGEDRLTLLRKLRVVTAQGAVAVFEMEATDSRGRKVTFEVLMLPLMHARPSVDRLLGAMAPVRAPDWLGEMPLGEFRLKSFDLRWPARPISDTLGYNTHDVILPHVRHARIVRQDRRQFRVYDGGRTVDGGDKP